MDFTTIGFAIGAMVVGIFYMQRRRAPPDPAKTRP